MESVPTANVNKSLNLEKPPTNIKEDVSEKKQPPTKVKQEVLTKVESQAKLQQDVSKQEKKSREKVKQDIAENDASQEKVEQEIPKKSETTFSTISGTKEEPRSQVFAERLVPSMSVEPPTPPVTRSSTVAQIFSSSANDQKRPSQHVSDICDEPLPKSSKLEKDQIETDNIEIEERFPTQDEKFTPSKFKRRQSKKILPRKDMDAPRPEASMEVEDEEISSLSNKNLYFLP